MYVQIVNRLPIITSMILVTSIIKPLLRLNRDPNEEEEDPHPRGFWLILLVLAPLTLLLIATFLRYENSYQVDAQGAR